MNSDQCGRNDGDDVSRVTNRDNGCRQEPSVDSGVSGKMGVKTSLEKLPLQMLRDYKGMTVTSEG